MGLIYIVTLSQLEGKKIVDTLESIDLGRYAKEYEFIRPQQLQDRLNPDVDLLVYNHHGTLSLNLQQEIQSWRKRGFLSSVVMLSKVLDLGLFDQFENLNNFVLVEKPYDEKDLQGVTRKLLTANHVMQRKFRRFTTDQSVAVTSYKTDFRSSPRVDNISLGGLCLQGKWDNLNVGDLLQINFSLDKLNVQRVMNGRVIWVQQGEQCAAGIKFLKEEEVYGQLLRDIG